MRKKVSICIKFLIGILALLAVMLACIFAIRDGYSHWSKRLLYFTQLSNIWIAIISLVLAVLMVFEVLKKKNLIKDYMYVLKFIFTVSITITGVIFCGFLAPFAGDSYNAWTFASIFTHVVVPVLSIVDFFVDDYKIVYKKSITLYSLIPPFAYFVFSIILGILNVDFGRGDTFPYFFLNFKSEAGFFGFVAGNGESLPVVGSMYFIIIFLILMWGIAFFYYKIHPQTREYDKNNTK